MNFLKWIDGRKTYLAIGVGIASAVVPVIGVPVAVAQGVAVVSGLVAIWGRYDASRKITEAFETGKAVGTDVGAVVKK